MKALRLCLLALLLSSGAHAIDSDSVARLDIVTIDPETLYYDEDDRTQLIPTRAFMEVIDYHPMSDGAGVRYALITLDNQLRTRTVLERENFVGIFADGERRNPIHCDETLDPLVRRSMVLNFGPHTFPLVKIIVDNGKK